MKKCNGVICDNCNYVYEGHTNIFGKVCTRCNSLIPPCGVLPIVEENQHKLKLAQHKLREHLFRRSNNANSK